MTSIEENSETLSLNVIRFMNLKESVCRAKAEKLKRYLAYLTSKIPLMVMWCPAMVQTKG